MSHIRFDQSRFDKAARTPQGYLKVPATVTRVGVLTYRRPDGSTVRELRPPEEVFHPESLATLSNLPLTNDHPFKMLDTKNTRHHVVGVTGDQAEKHDESHLRANVIVMDHETIADIESGKVEVSCGYRCDTEVKAGEFNGEKYDQIQRNIRYNHISVVKKGRAGATCRLHMDSQDDLVDVDINLQGGAMNEEEIKARVDAAVKEATEKMATDHKKVLEENQAKMDGLEADVKKAKEIEAASGDKQKQIDTMQARIDSLETDLKSRKDAADPKLVEVAVKARLQIEKVASSLLPASEKFDSETTNMDLMKKVILQSSPGAKLEDASETYVKARFDHIAEGIDLREASIKKANKVINDRRDGADLGSSEEARKKQTEDAKNAYKEPTAATKEK